MAAVTPDERSEYNRRYWIANRDRLLTRKRDQARRRKLQIRRKMQAFVRSWATLHDAGCPYPAKGCRCRAIVLIEP